ncbi:hypothetical protein BsWGS_14162 [Bradybaena similaris]
MSTTNTVRCVRSLERSGFYLLKVALKIFACTLRGDCSGKLERILWPRITLPATLLLVQCSNGVVFLKSSRVQPPRIIVQEVIKCGSQLSSVSSCHFRTTADTLQG